ncbi:MAG: aminotransferase class I/II-fold pyridoxal phosphate-dependent enzyme [Deltaproteobacteria bacterium]|nr:aminotransferase class I/II-fold pyridoxal phosphate-dependent enzyme [Deltaproteobacteria bacterium]
MPRVYLSSPHMSGAEQGLIRQAFDENWVAPLGPHVDAFERELAHYVGVGHAAALSAGTAAIHLALRLLGVDRDDEVLCSSLTFSASANPIVYQGAAPVFIDAEPSTWNMDPALLAEELEACAKRGKLPKAAIVVDLYGQSADWEPIRTACARHDVPIIEDAAEALGADYRGKKCGTFGKLGIFSFNGNKIITTSGGGMLVSDDQSLVERARFLATQARDPAPHYEHSAIGFNYRLSNICAAIGRAQLGVLDERVAARRAIFQRYREGLADLPGIAFMPEAPWGRSTRWLTCILVDEAAFGASREDIRLALAAQDIEARPVWKPMHQQPVFRGCRVRGGAVSAGLFERGLCLPSGSNLSVDDQARVIDVVRTISRR